MLIKLHLYNLSIYTYIYIIYAITLEDRKKLSEILPILRKLICFYFNLGALIIQVFTCRLNSFNKPFNK